MEILLRLVPKNPLKVTASKIFITQVAHYTRLAEVGKLESPKASGKYDTGQLILHKVFGYRGVILFPWLARVYDRDASNKKESPDASTPTDASGDSLSNVGKEVKGRTHTFYQVLIDTRDAPYIRAQTEAVTFLGNQESSRSLYAIPGLDYVAHDDIIPYTSVERVPLQHELFDKFLMLNPDKERMFWDRGSTQTARRRASGTPGHGRGGLGWWGWRRGDVTTPGRFVLGSLHYFIRDSNIDRCTGAHKTDHPPFIAQETLRAWQKKNHPWLELSDVHRETTEGVRVTVIPFYMGSRESQNSAVYWWRYCIRLENLGSSAVQLRERHWRIFSLSGTLETVRGRGVVGQEPVLARHSPAFQYSSHVSLQAPSGHMWGTFRMEREDGYTFDCRIPPFSLESKPDEGAPVAPAAAS